MGAVMYYYIVISFIVTVTSIGIVCATIGTTIMIIDDSRDRRPRLWPQLIYEAGGTLVAVGLVCFGAAALNNIEMNILGKFQLWNILGLLIIGTCYLVAIALGLLRRVYKARLYRYLKKHGLDAENNSNFYISNN
jgi:hypothetical protein